jgi:hypothetical protein
MSYLHIIIQKDFDYCKDVGTAQLLFRRDPKCAYKLTIDPPWLRTVDDTKYNTELCILYTRTYKPSSWISLCIKKTASKSVGEI